MPAQNTFLANPTNQAYDELSQFCPKPPSQTRVIVGLSGGVDSSVSAALLKAQGFLVEGLFMKNWEEDDGTEYCTAMADLADAQAVCDTLGIELHKVNFSMEYWDRVFEYFLAEYAAGRTPNPDILCNKEIKFKAFLDYAQMLGADFIATGHYCQRGLDNYSAKLHRGADSNKDQSYFLHAVPGKKIARTLFPVGMLQKSQVRRIAADHHLATAKKKDSTGICFIGERRFKDFLEQYLPAQPGKIVTDSGEVIGNHDGLMFYTLGQRGGIGIGGISGYDEKPWFVLQKKLSSNILVVGQGHDHPMLMSTKLTAGKIDWVLDVPKQIFSSQGFRCYAKTRYRQPDQACTVYAADSNHIDVIFDHPQRAVTPGQSVVFYNQSVCLGGGIIIANNAPN